ncbi:hypothetical protein BLNAU_10687 [Blattamonas nauphoetae]|uniref:Uncharacterized protein n=1 Tax=Blattamonas nauphoetae TaxID=2049346 RepID=A0ABQ9XT17_9EUKA|nr:hypothetical protein BLNAU_10687 [Blattamonas nauphoetae]
MNADKINFHTNTATLTIDFIVTGKSSYTVNFSVEPISYEPRECNVVFKNKDRLFNLNFEFPAGETKFTKFIEIGGEDDDKKLCRGITYTITANDLTCIPDTFTPADNTVVTGFSKLTYFDKTKPDGTRDKVKLTFENGLIPARKPADLKNSVTLESTAPKKKEPKVYILDDSDKYTWTRDTGVLTVEYLFKDCDIKAGSKVTAVLCAYLDECFMHQPIDYAEGANGVASVIAAVFAVLALVF